ncbi:hypothetical protein LXL04_009191 [Taraxacum kok-saghyz]
MVSFRETERPVISFRNDGSDLGVCQEFCVVSGPAVLFVFWGAIQSFGQSLGEYSQFFGSHGISGMDFINRTEAFFGTFLANSGGPVSIPAAEGLLVRDLAAVLGAPDWAVSGGCKRDETTRELLGIDSENTRNRLASNRAELEFELLEYLIEPSSSLKILDS